MSDTNNHIHLTLYEKALYLDINMPVGAKSKTQHTKKKRKYESSKVEELTKTKKKSNNM